MAEPCATIFIGDLPGELTADEFSAVFGAFGTVAWSKMWKGGKGGKQAALVEFSTVDEATWVVENVNGNIPEGLSTPVMVKYKEESSKSRQKGGAEAAGGKGGGGKDRGGPYSKNGAAAYQVSPYGDKGGKGGGGWKGGKGGEFCARDLVGGLYASGAMPGGTRYENDENAVYVAGLPKDATDETLYQIFSPFGAIAPKGVRAMMDPEGGCKGFGFVNFLDQSGAQSAIATLNGAEMPNGTTLAVKTKSPGGKSGGKGGKEKGA